ncbi:MAG: hypothetical protein IJJ26_07430 [Victivallales bacterium]|nr:hypothetical protein [Victivallales bacterium]
MRHALLALACLAVFLTSCDNDSSAKSHYQRGLDLVGQDSRAATRQFLLAIGRDRDAALAHYQLAILYDQDPQQAPFVVWNLQQYLVLKPDAENREETLQWLTRAEKSCVAVLSKKSGATQLQEFQVRLKLLEEHALRQKQWISDLSRENIELRRKLAEVSK